MDMVMGVHHPALVGVEMGVRLETQAIASFDAAEFPYADRDPPRQQKHADDEVA
jgi:hypothetical protein